MSSHQESLLLQSNIDDFKGKIALHFEGVKENMEQYTAYLLGKSGSRKETTSSPTDNETEEEEEEEAPRKPDERAPSQFAEAWEALLIFIQVWMVRLSARLPMGIWNGLALLGFAIFSIMYFCWLTNSFICKCDMTNPNFWCLFVTEEHLDPLADSCT